MEFVSQVKSDFIEEVLSVFFFSAVHATAGRWAPPLMQCASILSHSHPLTATDFLDIVSPSRECSC